MGRGRRLLGPLGPIATQDRRPVVGVVARVTVGAVALATASGCVDDGHTAGTSDPVAEALTARPTADEPDPVEVTQEVLLVTIQHGQCEIDLAWCEFERGQDQASAGLGVEHRRLVPQSGVEGSFDDLIRLAIDMAPDGIAVSIDEDQPLLAETKESLNRSGIPVVTFGGDIDRLPEGLIVAAAVGQSNYRAGYDAGRLAAAGGASGGACINDRPDVRSFDLRCQGFYDALSGAGIEMRALAIPADYNRAAELAGRFVDRFPEIDAYLSTGAAAAEATANAIALSPFASSISHTSIDADLSTDGPLGSGRLSTGFADQPFLRGFQSVRVLTHLVRYDLLPSNRSVSTRTGPLTGRDLLERSSAGDQDELEIGILLPSSCTDELTWCPVESGARAAADALGVRLTLWFPDSLDANVALRRALEPKPDGVAIVVWDPETIRSSLVAAAEQGTPVVALATGTSESSPSAPMLTSIGHDDYRLGFAVGQRLIREGGSTRGLCLTTTVSYLPAEQQCAGFGEALAQANIAFALALLGTDPDQAAEGLERHLISHPETDFVFSTSPVGAAAVDGYLSRQGHNALLHATVGLSPATAESMTSGKMAFAADLQPYDLGFESVSLLAMSLRGDLLSLPSAIGIEPRFVTSADITQIEPLVGSVR